MIGERIICIKERALDNRLKVGMQFTIRDYSGVIGGNGNEYYVVVSDDSDDKIGWIESTYFRPLSEARLDKLVELGI